jgi:hypothetical protein
LHPRSLDKATSHTWAISSPDLGVINVHDTRRGSTPLGKGGHLVPDAVPEQTGELIELIESSERALVFDATIIRRINVPPKPRVGEEFFSSSNTRMFCTNSGCALANGATPLVKNVDKRTEKVSDDKQ